MKIFFLSIVVLYFTYLQFKNFLYVWIFSLKFFFIAPGCIKIGLSYSSMFFFYFSLDKFLTLGFTLIYSIRKFLNNNILALAGMAQWIEHWPVNEKVTSSIPSLGHMPGLWARSPVGGAQEATTQWCFSSSLSPSLPLSKNK